jgi:hypothetical protein
MCKAFSCIVLRDRTVLWKFGIESHDKILELNNIPDDESDADKVKFCRIEISPNNNNYLNPDKWIFKIDQKPIPTWIEEEHEKVCWKAFRNWKQELDKILIYKPIIHPFKLEPPEITDKHIALLREWASVRDSVVSSVGHPVEHSVWYSVVSSVGHSVGHSVWYSVVSSVGHSVGAYIGSFFVLPRSDWKYTEQIPTDGYPFQSAVTLWEMGLVPSFNGKIWRLHSKNGVVWKGKI